MSTPIVQYWDSCMFISLLTGKDIGRLPIIRDLIRELEDRKTIKIAISTFVLAEVRPDELNTTLTEEQFSRAVELLESEKLDLYPLTESIARYAQRIGKENPKLLPGDCIHIATALSCGASALFTFDGVFEGGRRRRPKEMLLHSEKIGTPPLKICEPFVPSGPLFEQPPASPVV